MFMKPKKKEAELIKGVIYDDPIVTKAAVHDTVTSLNQATDFADKMYDAISNQLPLVSDCDMPSRDEVLVSYTALSLLEPLANEGERNLLIPSQVLDDNLYNSLKKYDIGERVLRGYVSQRSSSDNTKTNNESKTNKNNILAIGKVEDGVLKEQVQFDIIKDRDDIIDYIENEIKTYNMTPEESFKLIESINDLLKESGADVIKF